MTASGENVPVDCILFFRKFSFSGDNLAHYSAYVLLNNFNSSHVVVKTCLDIFGYIFIETKYIFSTKWTVSI